MRYLDLVSRVLLLAGVNSCLSLSRTFQVCGIEKKDVFRQLSTFFPLTYRHYATSPLLVTLMQFRIVFET